MKILIITQVVDTEHAILGFFHRWIAEFAEQCEQVHVVCLQEGTHALPDNVTVHSLGKEGGVSRLKYLWRFYKYSWQLRREYDAVFVHMVPLYIILGTPLWRMLGKKIGMWYAHGAVNRVLKVAIAMVDTVFTSTPEGCRVDTPKKAIVGQGIDLRLFSTIPKTDTNKLEFVTVGRIAPSKNIDTLLQACAQLKAVNPDFRFSIIGTTLTEQEAVYEAQMRTLTTTLGLDDQVDWVGAVPQATLPARLQQADVFIHDGATNSLDKTLLEALLCGCVVTSSNPAYRAIAASISPDLLFAPRDADALGKILLALDMSDSTIQATQSSLKQYVESNFSIESLVSGIVGEY